MVKRVYAWLPDRPDPRDRRFGSATSKSVLPKTVSRLGRGNRIENQGALSSCTGNASTSALEILTLWTARSRLFTYYNARLLGNKDWVNVDDGAFIRDAIKSLFKYGSPPESKWPYRAASVNVRPSNTAYEVATSAQTALSLDYEYVRLTTLTQLKSALAAGQPVVFGFAVTEAFENIKKGDRYPLPVPTSGEKTLGGHAVVAVGYSDAAVAPYIEVRNSWGKAWGDEGHFYLDQKWFTDKRRLVDDMWVIRKKGT